MSRDNCSNRACGPHFVNSVFTLNVIQNHSTELPCLAETTTSTPAGLASHNNHPWIDSVAFQIPRIGFSSSVYSNATRPSQPPTQWRKHANTSARVPNGTTNTRRKQANSGGHLIPLLFASLHMNLSLSILPDSTLAIDWGSSATRAKVLYTMEDGEIVDKLLQNISGAEASTGDRHEVEGQFTSDIYPFDSTSPNPPGETVYPGNKRLLGRRCISSKLAMYSVVGISDEVARESPLFEDLQIQVQQNPNLKNAIRTGIEQLMYCVLLRVHSFMNCYEEDFRRDLDAVALTIPAQWTIEFEEEYGERFTAAWERVYNCAPPQLIFLTEGQTGAHYTFYRSTRVDKSERQHLFNKKLFSIGKQSNAVLLIDAGGHSTVRF